MKVVAVILSTFAFTFGAVIPSIEERIIGGTRTTIEQYPYQISLRYKGEHDCGGSILNKDTILTACHCVNESNYDLITIRAGSTIHSQGEEFAVAKIIEHPNYFEGAAYNNDMAILKLARPLTFSDKIQPIELQPKDSEVPAGTTAYVTGWGTTVAWLPLSPSKLRVADVDVVTNDKCQHDYEGEMKITSSMLCAQKAEKDACQGDSGGPLAANGKLIGVVSWGYGCANPKFPGVYANVATMHDFVTKYM